jgi:hypothetical protein
LITVALSTTIGAPARHVWRALTDPDERAAWDERILGKVTLSKTVRSRAAISDPDPDADFDRPQKIHWRFRLGDIPLVMQDRLVSAQRFKSLVSHISIGSMQFDQTLTLFSEDDETGPFTRLAMKLVARNSIAVIGDIIPRLDVQKIGIEYVDTTLRQVQKYCES